MDDKIESHLLVFEGRSEYVTSDGAREVFVEGPTSEATKRRIKVIKDAFKENFIEKFIEEVRSNSAKIDLDRVGGSIKNCIDDLVETVTSEVGRALVGLTVMQLSIKIISPEQSIRLHKGGNSKSSFSWVDGISMRTLDKGYVTPALRKFDLLRLNADGFMMTRSLAENYPYSLLYKAQLKGARHEWLEIVEALEANETDPRESLKYLISVLFNKAEDFLRESHALLLCCQVYCKKDISKELVMLLLESHIDSSDYAARLMEISMHSLMQAVVESGALGASELKPLSQMRSANKKHGNIGDIELLENDEIVESWDAKFGKSYLRDEIDEAFEKIPKHPSIGVVGFVTTGEPLISPEILKKIKDGKDLYSIEIQILTFDSWVENVFDRALKSGLVTSSELAKNWILAYAESLAQKRREIAPIDEPCIEWVRSLKRLIDDQI
jgi:hypothetical protein